MAQQFFLSLKTHGSTDPFRQQMLDFKGLNALLGTNALLDEGHKYSAENFLN
jgi:hypothetical protein